MNCPGCGRGNRADARFCDSCGSALEVTCARCDRELRAGARFCDGCGAEVGGAPATVAPAAAWNSQKRLSTSPSSGGPMRC